MSSLRLPRLVVALLAAVVLVAGACSSDPPAVVVSGSDPATAPRDIVETLEAEGFTVLVALLEEAELTDTLRDGEGDETFTLFAPTDDAFASMAPGLAELLAGEDDVVAPPLESDGESDEGTVPQDEPDEGETTDGETTDGQDTDGETTDGQDTEGETDGATTDGQDTEGETDGATDGEADGATEGQEATGGTDDEADPADPTTQGAASAASGQTPPTPLAERPPREEIRAVLADILEHHVVEGTILSTELEAGTTLTSLEGGTIELSSREEDPATEGGEPTEVLLANEADISETDLVTTNGVIHTIDEVMVPADRLDDVEQLINSIPVTSGVLPTLASTGEHGELLDAIERAGLTGQLEDADALTVFAPTDAAFAGLTPEQRAALQDQEVLAELILHHAVSRTVAVADVRAEEVIQTMAGDEIRMEVDGDTVTVDDATIEDSIETTTGVVHVIDGILVPEAASGPGGF